MNDPLRFAVVVGTLLSIVAGGCVEGAPVTPWGFEGPNGSSSDGATVDGATESDGDTASPAPDGDLPPADGSTPGDGTSDTDAPPVDVADVGGDGGDVPGDIGGSDGDGGESDGEVGPEVDAGASCDGGRWGSWKRQMGTPRDEQARALAADGCAGVYVAGATKGVIFEGSKTKRFSDAYLVKYATSGKQKWVRILGTNEYETAAGVAVGPGGAIYVTGITTGPLGGGTYRGDLDTFLAKFSPSGTRRWVKLLGSFKRDRAYDVAVGGGSVYVVGETDGPLAGESYNGGVRDAFIAKYDTTGARKWVHLLGTTGSERATAAVGGASGELYVVGNTTRSIGGGTHSGNGRDGFLARYDGSGNRSWIALAGGSGSTTFSGLAVAPSGRLYVSGRTTGTVAGRSYNGGTSDALVAKYTASGGHRWTRLFGTATEESAMGIAADPGGGVHVAGSIEDAIAGQQFNGGATDGFVVRYDSAGGRGSVRLFGSARDDVSRDVALDGAGDRYVTGEAGGTIDHRHYFGRDDAYLVKW